MRPIRSLGLFFILSIQFVFSSCLDTRKSLYFNGIGDSVLTHLPPMPVSLIQKGDLLNITVSSLNPDASGIFNMGGMTSPASSVSNSPMTPSGQGAGSSASSAASASQQSSVPGYLVNDRGFIKFPIIGEILAEGKRKQDLEDTLETILESKKLLINPIVTVKYLNFRVTVIGEVSRPTTINVSSDRISILEALGLAGDITVYGKKENVLLVREDNSQKIVKRLDLNSPTILSSPYYYLQTNDVVYVEARKEKVLSTSRTQQLLPIIISALSFLAIITVQILK